MLPHAVEPSFRWLPHNYSHKSSRAEPARSPRARAYGAPMKPLWHANISYRLATGEKIPAQLAVLAARGEAAFTLGQMSESAEIPASTQVSYPATELLVLAEPTK